MLLAGDAGNDGNVCLSRVLDVVRWCMLAVVRVPV